MNYSVVLYTHNVDRLLTEDAHDTVKLHMPESCSCVYVMPVTHSMSEFCVQHAAVAHKMC